MADHVFVTNGDCREYAERLEIPSFSAMIHPVDTHLHLDRDETEIAALRQRYGAEVLLFCPLRHDWSVTDTDVHLRALAGIAERLQGWSVRLVLNRWGAQIADGEQLLADLGVADKVAWAAPMSRKAMVRHLQAADVVLDQIALPHFGGTAPQALSAGTPVVMSYRPESTAWIINEPAPISPAFTPEDVVQAVIQALDPAWRSAFRRRAADWVRRHHHEDRIIGDHLAVYRRLLPALSLNAPPAVPWWRRMLKGLALRTGS